VEDLADIGLKAGLLLRRMQELSNEPESDPAELERIRSEAKTLHEKWHSLMCAIYGQALACPGESVLRTVESEEL
jgi:hypothetical protein